jgi:hypothetical protein
VGGIELGPDEHLYVLDRLYGKVVVFTVSGGLDRVFRLPQGPGPGEFIRVRSMTVAPDGRVIVLDGSNGRVTEILADGALGRMQFVSERTPYELRSAGDSLVITLRYASEGDPAALVWDHDWNVADRLFPVTALEAAQASFGEWGALASSVDGDLLFSPILPGTWRSASGSEVGRVLYPEMTGQQRSSGALYFPVKVRAMSTLPDASLLQYVWVSRPEDHPEYDQRRDDLRLLHLSPDGTVLADVAWPGPADVVGVYSPPGAEALYVGVTSPFPQVIQYQLRVGTVCR